MRNSHNLMVDVVALVVYLVVANPVFTGLAIHEWLSIGIFFVFIVHLALHHDWVITTVKAAFKTPSWATTGNLILDIGILVVFCLDIVSGLLVSRHILPAAGFFAEGYFVWKPIHALSSKLLLALIIIHIVVHWKWFASLLGRRTGGRDTKKGG